MSLDKGSLVFFDVDTQYDFMFSKGKLYVPKAEKIIPNLSRLTKFARKKGVRVYASADAHLKSDKEMIASGGPFPFHCMLGEKGQKKIAATALAGAAVVKNAKLPAAKIASLRKKRNLIIQKQSYTVFENPNIKTLLSGVKAAVVYGVATEYCVKAAVLGLARMKGLRVYVVSDAIKPITAAGERKALAEMKKAGAKFLTTKEVEGLVVG